MRRRRPFALLLCLGVLLGGCIAGTDPEAAPQTTTTPAPTAGAAILAESRADPTATAAVAAPSPCTEAAVGGPSPPDAVGEPHLVVVGELNLRAGPGTDCPVLATLGFGTIVAVQGQPVDRDGYAWRRLRTPKGEGFSIAPALHPVPERRPAAVPVFMYHLLGDEPDRFTVTRPGFEAHLRWLRANGYATITPSDLLAALEDERPLPPKPVMITIDDYWVAAPGFLEMLRWHGFRGTYFLPNEADLTAAEVVEMARQGEVCGHTVSHPYLGQLSPPEERREIGDNKSWLEAILGRPVVCFGYPFGSYSEATAAILAEVGYRIAFDSAGGVAPIGESLDRWHVPRIEVIGEWTLEEFAASVAPGTV